MSRELRRSCVTNTKSLPRRCNPDSLARLALTSCMPRAGVCHCEVVTRVRPARSLTTTSHYYDQPIARNRCAMIEFARRKVKRRLHRPRPRADSAISLNRLRYGCLFPFTSPRSRSARGCRLALVSARALSATDSDGTVLMRDDRNLADI